MLTDGTRMEEINNTEDRGCRSLVEGLLSMYKTLKATLIPTPAHRRNPANDSQICKAKEILNKKGQTGTLSYEGYRNTTRTSKNKKTACM